MASPYKIKITGAGVSTDLFNILYNTTVDATLVVAPNAYGSPSVNLTQAQLLAGYTVMLPANVAGVFILDANGVCNGKTYSITIGPAPTPAPTSTPLPTSTPIPPTATPIPTNTPTPTPTISPTPTVTPTQTPIPTYVPPTPTPTPTITPTPTVTPTPTPSATSTTYAAIPVTEFNGSCANLGATLVYLDYLDYQKYATSTNCFNNVGSVSSDIKVRNLVGGFITSGYFQDDCGITWRITNGELDYKIPQC